MNVFDESLFDYVLKSITSDVNTYLFYTVDKAIEKAVEPLLQCLEALVYVDTHLEKFTVNNEGGVNSGGNRDGGNINGSSINSSRNGSDYSFLTFTSQNFRRTTREAANVVVTNLLSWADLLKNSNSNNTNSNKTIC